MDNFKFSIDAKDTIFVLTQNKSMYKENVEYIVSKMVVFKEYQVVDMDSFIKALDIMKIKKLNIFSISNKFEDKIKITSNNINSSIRYIEISRESFVLFINNNNADFLNYNKKR